MQRVVVLGPGGAGKTTLARQVGERLGLPVVELDKHFWGEDLVPPSEEQWRDRLYELTEQPKWIMDGDLGPYDVVEPRLRAADTVVLLASLDGGACCDRSGDLGSASTTGGGCGHGAAEVVPEWSPPSLEKLMARSSRSSRTQPRLTTG